MLKSANIIAIIVIIAAVILAALNWPRIKALFYIEHMESDSRVAHLDVAAITRDLSIKPGDRIADVGAGSGLFTRAMSRLVAPGGVIYAVDINKRLLAHIDRKSRDEGIQNVRTVLCVEDDPLIPGKVDLIFMCDTLHYIQNQESYINKLISYVKPGGRIAIIDFKTHWPPMSVKFTAKQLVAWMSAAHCTMVDSFDYIEDELFMIFQRK